MNGRYGRFDRFGGAPPSFVVGPQDEGLVEMKTIFVGGVEGLYPFLTEAGRAQYELDNGGPHPQGWAKAPYIID